MDKLKKICFWFLCCFFGVVVFYAAPAAAQPVLDAQNMALGSGGTAYLSGVEATFWNPANLMVNNRYGKLHIEAGNTGMLYLPVLSNQLLDEQFDNFTKIFGPYDAEKAQLKAGDRQQILDNNYYNARLRSRHQSRTDILLGGFVLQKGTSALSVAARTRIASQILVGRGWYSDNYIDTQQEVQRSFTLHQQKNKLFELSVGFAQDFTFIDGLSSNLSNLYVGFAPKLVVAGSSFDLTYDGRYFAPNENAAKQPFSSAFRLQSSGNYTKAIKQYQRSGDAAQSIKNNFSRGVSFRPTAYGIGFDFGLTYLIPLGSDLPTLDHDPRQSVIYNSIRLSFSVNDIGALHYVDQPLTLSSPRDTLQVKQQPVMNTFFNGTDGQFISYFDAAKEISNPLIKPDKNDNNSYQQLLPASLNTGAMIQFSKIKLMGDLSLGLNNTAFTNTKLSLHVGLEGHPLPFLPLRVGSRLAAGLPTLVGFGTGVETKHWDFSLGSQIILRSNKLNTEFAGGAVAGIKVHY